MNLRSRLLGVALCLLVGRAATAANPPGAPDDHFLCYKAAITKGTAKFTPVSPVNLTDGFQPVTFAISKPTLICDPADNQGDGIVNPAIDLESYKIKASSGSPKHTPQTITVVNEINPTGLVIDTKKADLLLVPTAVDQSSVPPAPSPASHDVDLYKCYTVKLSAGQPKFPAGIQRTLGAQFTTPARLFDVKKPKHLCVPVSQNGSVIKRATGYQMCYQVKPAKGQPKHTPVHGLLVGNEFLQGESLDTKKDAELCVPSIVNPTCGDGVKNQISEQCDGTDDSACPGQCSHLCFCRQQLSFVLDSAGSQLAVRGVNALGAGVDRDLALGGLSGTITITIEGPTGGTGSGQYEISVPVTALPPIDVSIPPIGSVGTACVFLEEDPDRPGSGLSGSGVLNCFGSAVTALPSPDFNAYQDHCTNGTACDSGTVSGCAGVLGNGGKVHSLTGECVPAAQTDTACVRSDVLTGTVAELETALDPHPGTCNSPLYGVFGSAQWNPGDVVLTLNAAIDLRGAMDPCLGPPTTAPITAPMTTGKAVSAIMDAFPSIAPAAGKVQAVSVAGTPFMCSPFGTSGATLVTSAPLLDLPLPAPFGLADVNLALVLKAQ
jgi:hypothetical protein